MTDQKLPAEFRFAPLEEFDWKREMPNGETYHVGTYYLGNTYNCTMEPRHDALRAKCAEWAEAGKIQIIPLPPGKRFITVKPGE